jgi:hypothetical protein
MSVQSFYNILVGWCEHHKDCLHERKYISCCSNHGVWVGSGGLCQYWLSNHEVRDEASKKA